MGPPHLDPLPTPSPAPASPRATQGVETHKERNKKRLGWATTAVHGTMGAVCLWRGLKDGLPK